MGRFRCVACGKKYYEKRFIWEEDHCSEDAARAQRRLERRLRKAGMATDLVETIDEERQLADGDSAIGRTRSNVDDLRVYADTARASGTAANITGTLAPSLGALCAPVSVVGGAVGLSSGAAQLNQGLSMPSGEVDPHLVAKGGVTAGVGTTCMMLGAGAVFAPGLFVAAVGLGVTGLATATFLDSKMNGLCSVCRVVDQSGGKDEGAAASAEAAASDADRPQRRGSVRTGAPASLAPDDMKAWWNETVPRVEQAWDKLFDTKMHTDEAAALRRARRAAQRSTAKSCATASTADPSDLDSSSFIGSSAAPLRLEEDEVTCEIAGPVAADDVTSDVETRNALVEEAPATNDFSHPRDESLVVPAKTSATELHA